MLHDTGPLDWLFLLDKTLANTMIRIKTRMKMTHDNMNRFRFFFSFLFWNQFRIKNLFFLLSFVCSIRSSKLNGSIFFWKIVLFLSLQYRETPYLVPGRTYVQLIFILKGVPGTKYSSLIFEKKYKFSY